MCGWFGGPVSCCEWLVGFRVFGLNAISLCLCPVISITVDVMSSVKITFGQVGKILDFAPNKHEVMPMIL